MEVDRKGEETTSTGDLRQLKELLAGTEAELILSQMGHREAEKEIARLENELSILNERFLAVLQNNKILTEENEAKMKKIEEYFSRTDNPKDQKVENPKDQEEKVSKGVPHENFPKTIRPDLPAEKGPEKPDGVGSSGVKAKKPLKKPKPNLKIGRGAVRVGASVPTSA